MKRICLGAVVCFVFAVGVSGAAARKWTDTTGKFNVEAEFVEVQNGKVRLKKPDGKIVVVPLEKLSAADQAFVKSRPSSKSAGAASSKPGAAAKILTGKTAPIQAFEGGQTSDGVFTGPQVLALVAVQLKAPATIWIESPDKQKALETTLKFSDADATALRGSVQAAKPFLMVATENEVWICLGNVSLSKTTVGKSLASAIQSMGLSVPCKVNLSITETGARCLVCRPSSPLARMKSAASASKNPANGSSRP
jgi:hypothetical protein